MASPLHRMNPPKLRKTEKLEVVTRFTYFTELPVIGTHYRDRESRGAPPRSHVCTPVFSTANVWGGGIRRASEKKRRNYTHLSQDRRWRFLSMASSICFFYIENKMILRKYLNSWSHFRLLHHYLYNHQG